MKILQKMPSNNKDLHSLLFVSTVTTACFGTFLLAWSTFVDPSKVKIALLFTQIAVLAGLYLSTQRQAE